MEFFASNIVITNIRRRRGTDRWRLSGDFGRHGRHLLYGSCCCSCKQTTFIVTQQFCSYWLNTCVQPVTTETLPGGDSVLFLCVAHVQ